ncbi:MAG: hypothetical protein ACFBSC_09565 [Microcoleaceae cyanobacterium]
MTYEQPPPQGNLPQFQNNRIPLTVTFSQGRDHVSRTFPYTLTHGEMRHYLDCLEMMLSFTPDDIKAALHSWQWKQLNNAIGEDSWPD